jgi:acylphosphatase
MSFVSTRQTRRYIVRGRVQGVGFRDFTQHRATAIGVRGWVRNLDDGSVEAVAIGTPDQLAEFSGALHKGPRWSDVRGVDEIEHEPIAVRDFTVKH